MNSDYILNSTNTIFNKRDAVILLKTDHVSLPGRSVLPHFVHNPNFYVLLNLAAEGRG